MRYVNQWLFEYHLLWKSGMLESWSNGLLKGHHHSSIPLFRHNLIKVRITGYALIAMLAVFWIPMIFIIICIIGYL